MHAEVEEQERNRHGAQHLDRLHHDARKCRLRERQGDAAHARVDERQAQDLLTDSSSDTGEIAFPTTSYGVGNWHLFNNRPDRAREIFEKILDSEAWAAFGYLAAEAELAREQER